MLFKPKFYKKRITDITPAFLKKHNIKAVILDVDNTLAIKKGKILLGNVPSWLEAMEKEGIKLIILSNATVERMSGFAAKVNLPFVGLGLKPLPFGYFRAAKRVGVKIKECAIIGDQLFTDVLGGNLAGCKTVLVSPVELEQTKLFNIKRGLERKLLKKYKLPCEF